MEELTNRQIILLTMLVSFVISTATGIITVAMLEEAPKTLTQTVNHVVERTIERVVTGTSTVQVAPPMTTINKEVTIYAKEDDLVVSAVEKNQPRIAEIFGSGKATTSSPDAMGFVISRDGILVTTASSLLGVSPETKTYKVLIGEKEYDATLIAKNEYSGLPIAFLRLTLDSGESVDAVSFAGSTSQLKVAQTAVVLGADSSLGIFKTTLAKINYSAPVGTSTKSSIMSVDTSPRIPSGYEGALVVNLDGQTVGIAVGNGEGKSLSIYPAASILDLVSAVSAKETIEDKKAGTP